MPLLAGLVSHWTADNTANDAVGGNHGSLVSGATYAAGQIGQAFSFDGINDRVQVQDSESLRLTGSLTIEAWIKATSLPTEHGFVLFRGDDRGGLDPYELGTTPGGGMKFGVSSLTAGSSNRRLCRLANLFTWWERWTTQRVQCDFI